jgi:hypothetical protein
VYTVSSLLWSTGNFSDCLIGNKKKLDLEKSSTFPKLCRIQSVFLLKNIYKILSGFRVIIHGILLIIVFIGFSQIVTTINYSAIYNSRSPDSAVGIATGRELDDRGVEVRVPLGSRIFSHPCRPHRLWGPPPTYPMGTGGSFSCGKAAGA